MFMGFNHPGKRAGELLRMLILSVCGLAAASCELDFSGPEEKEVEDTLEVYLSRQTLRADQGEISVTVFSNREWTVSLEDATWGFISDITPTGRDHDGTCKVTVTFNTGDDARENAIVVRAGSSEVRWSFMQVGLNDYFSTRELVLGPSRTGSVSFLASDAWTAELISGKDWCELKTPSGIAGNSQISCSAREEWVDVGSREAMVRLTINGQFILLPVIQNQKDVILLDDGEPGSLSFDFHEQQFSLTTRQNVNYSVTVSDESWIHLVGTKSLYESQLEFSLSRNETSMARSGEIVLVCEENPSANLTVPVTQEAIDPILKSTDCGFYGIEGSQYVYGSYDLIQLSRLTQVDGAWSFRLLNPARPLACVLSDLPGNFSIGAFFDVKLSVFDKGFTIFSRSYPVTVIEDDGAFLWLRSTTDSAYFIIKR